MLESPFLPKKMSVINNIIQFIGKIGVLGFGVEYIFRNIFNHMLFLIQNYRFAFNQKTSSISDREAYEFSKLSYYSMLRMQHT